MIVLSRLAILLLPIPFLLLSSRPVTAASPVVVDANNMIVGFYVGLGRGTSVTVITGEGFSATFDLASGDLSYDAYSPWGGGNLTLGAIYYVAADCTGDGHMLAPPQLRGGFVIRLAESMADYYVPKGEPVVEFMPGSRRNPDGVCQTGNVASFQSWIRVLPNVQDLTGVGPSTFIGPLRIEVAQIDQPSGLIFADSLEGSVT